MRRARKDFVGRTHDAALRPGVRELLDGDAVDQGLGSKFLCKLKTKVSSVGIQLVAGSATSVILLSSQV